MRRRTRSLPTSFASLARPSNVAGPCKLEPVIKPTLDRLSRFISPNLPQYGRFIPAQKGVNGVLGATDEYGVKSNGPGPASGQLQGKLGGVAPAGLSPDRTARGRS